MIINTKNVKNGHITINDSPIFVGIPVRDFFKIIQKEQEADKEFSSCVGYQICTVFEDNIPVKVCIYVKDDSLEYFKLEYKCGRSESGCDAFIDEWVKERDLECYAGNMYHTCFGGVHLGIIYPFDQYGANVTVKVSNKEFPKRLFPALKPNDERSLSFQRDGINYRLQRLLHTEDYKFHVLNVIADKPVRLDFEREGRPSKNDRLEDLSFALIKEGPDGKDTVLGVFEFTYMAIRKNFEAGDLFYVLDGISACAASIGHLICQNPNLLYFEQISPYLLHYDGCIGELPSNKELDDFLQNKDNIWKVLVLASKLAAKHVKVCAEEITTIEVYRDACDSCLPMHKQYDGAHYYFGNIGGLTGDSDVFVVCEPDL